MTSVAAIDPFDAWLAELPQGWSLKKVGREFSNIGSGTTPPTDNQEWYGGGYPWVTTGELRENVIYSTEKSVTDDAVREFTTLRRYMPGTLLVAMYGATIGRLGLLGCEATTNQACCALSEPLNLEPKYVFYWLQAFREQLIRKASGGGQPNVNQDVIRELRISSPARVIQQPIVSFLDDKTARIDALIAEKERLVVSVREYEQAELSRILTHGLGASPMVPTKRQFITEAPAHWRVIAFKRALVGLGQGWSPQCEGRPAEANEWGVLKVGCVNGTSFNVNENKALPPALAPDLTCVLQRGDVLVSRANTRELVGMAALVEEDHPNILICDKLYRLKLRQDWVTPEFTVLVLRSDAARRQIELGASGASSSMQNISQDVIRELLVALPPLNEQAEIVTQAKIIRESCNSLVHHCEEHIARLREYRSSLISAAVTGQLDVDKNNATKN